MPALVLTCALGASAQVLAGCGGSAPPRPAPVLHRFLAAWSHGDWAEMRAEVTDPPADFRTVNAQAFAALGVQRATFDPGPIQTVKGRRGSPSTATVAIAEHYTLPHIGSWADTSTVHLVLHRHTWKVAWSPQTIDPQLHAGETIAVSRNWPARAPILGAGGAPLTRTGTEVTVGLVGSRVNDYGAVRTDLLAAGATSAEVTQAVALARAHPQDFEPVFTVTYARFQTLKARSGPENVYQVPGTFFQTAMQSGAITPQLAAHVVGTVGPISAAELHRLGSPYDAQSVVGQSGLEQTEERTLAGTPTIEINVDDAGGNPISRLATFRGRSGHAVRTSIDPRVQRAAESALAGATRPNVAMVAIQASTGRVLAIVSDPVTTYDTALEGAYPPGSTFKVITSTALFRKGLTPSSPANCPSTITVDGESFHNAGNEAPTPTITQAFIESCNTAYIGLAMAHLSPADFPAAAALYGLNGSPHLGLPAFYANVSAPSSRTQQAADAIGQGSITFSTLGMATVAAAIDAGTWHAPTLVQGPAAGRPTPARKLPTAIVDGLRPMMLGVVQSGTAAGTGLPAGTHAKTGTAEYGTGPEASLKIDGWLMGYDRNIAFAIVTQDTGGADGGPVDGPLIAKFFRALGY
ncbi:MAG TPA: penicillin-binding transpeptidase domain-containing protein [Solirubrobacteraceae bacterium]|nr:penicillin-binding transpeptidase domain-containing protein [Solirubrobacteraceae bacterium]